MSLIFCAVEETIGNKTGSTRNQLYIAKNMLYGKF